MKFPFSWLAHWKTLFTPSFVWKERRPHRWLLFSCHSCWNFLCSFLHYPQVKPRLAKKTFPRIRKKLNTKNILLHLSLSWECSGLSHILSVHKGLCCFFFLAEFPCSSLVCFPQKKGTAFIKGGFGYVLLLAWDCLSGSTFSRQVPMLCFGVLPVSSDKGWGVFFLLSSSQNGWIDI